MKKTFTLKGIGIFVMMLFLAGSAFAQTPNLTVAKDGSGSYTTVQAAINAAPTGQTTPYIIFIKNGKYKEKINIPTTKPFIQLLGESVGNVILTFDDYSGKLIPGGGGSVYGTSTSASFTVSAPDFAATNITFENTTGESPQALAINVTGDRSVFKNCRFLGGQDTIYAGGNGARQNFRNCYIDGTVDFIFGDARAIFDSCVIYPKTRSTTGSSYITAANTKQTEAYGYVFRDCAINANRGSTVYFLGRPWQNDAGTADASKSWNKVTFLNTTMTNAVQSVGWSTWDAGTDVTKISNNEYKSRNFDSSLVDVSSRVSWSNQLANTNTYTNANLFGTWDPCAVTADFCAYTPRSIAVSNFKGVKGTTTAAFTWNISWPMTTIKYEVMRSSDKLTFTSISNQTSINDTAVNFNFSEVNPPAGQTYYYIIKASKSGYATHISDTVSISSTPLVTVTGSLGSFLEGGGVATASQSYIVSAVNLTNNLIITAPTAFELSTNSSTWNTSSNPVVIAQDANGNIANTTIFVRLNAATAGTYGGNILHTNPTADTVRLAVAGTAQTDPLTVSTFLAWWPLSSNNSDSSGVRAVGVTPSTPLYNKLYSSNGTTVAAVPAYSPTFGQAFGVTSNGDGSWSAASGGPGSTLNRNFYEQFVIKASTGYSLRIDSLILSSSFYGTTSGIKLAVVYSKKGFTTNDSSSVTSGYGTDGMTTLPGTANGGFTTPIVLNNETSSTSSTYRFAVSVDSLRNLASGDSLTVRLYYACGSSSAGRYAKLKNLQFKGLVTVNPTTNDFRSHQTGNWTDLNSWEQYNGTAWVTPSIAYPVYNNSNTTTVANGHTLTISATLANGSGYIRRTKISTGGQLIINSGASVNIANDGAPSTLTTDLQVDGTLTNFGALFTNGNVSTVINGNFVHSGTNMNFSNTGDTVNVGPTGKYQHNVNSSTTPANLIWQTGSTFLITGMTTAQTGLFRNTIKYQNIIWNNTGQTAYYAARTTLDTSNVKGSFTVQSTGTSNITFANSSARNYFQNGYYQTGGIVNYKESGNIADTLDIGGDFMVTGGTFNTNMGTGSSLLIRLNGISKTLTYGQTGATNTNWLLNGSYSLGATLPLASSGYSLGVNGTLNALTYGVNGAGDFSVNTGGIVTTGSATGMDGCITNTGAKTFNGSSTYIFNGSVAQVTGASLPLTISALTINNLAGVSLSANSVNVTGALSLSNGLLSLGANSLTTSSILKSTSAKYVVTDGVGTLKITNIGSVNTALPIGPSTSSYNPVTINNSGTVDNYSASVKTTFDTPVPDATKVVNRQWLISEDVVGGSNVTLSLSWLIADQASGFNPLALVSIIHYNGSIWESFPATVTGAGTLASPYVATAPGITSFSPFAVINSSALPLSLLSFNGTYNGKVNLSWKTNDEVNTKEFVVTRSTDGITYTNVLTIAAKNTMGVNDYASSDANPAKGINYYRLKMIDKDGVTKYSTVIAINISQKNVLSINTNAIANQLQVTYPNAATPASFKVIATDGKTLVSIKAANTSGQINIDVSPLKTGIYILQFDNGTDKISQRFIKQ